MLTAEADASLLRVALNVLFPAFIINYLLPTRALDDVSGVFVAAGCGLFFVLLGLAVGFGAGSLIGKKGEARRTFAVATGMQNYGFIPIPILIDLFDDSTIGVHLMHTLGVEIALWTAAVMLLTGGKRGGWKSLLNAPLITTVVCLLLNLTGQGPTIAENSGFVMRAVEMLAACAVPLSLLLIGAAIRDLLRAQEPGKGANNTAVEAIAAIAVRLAIVPLLILLCARFLPLSIELKRVLVVQAAMPAAVFPIILTRRYGGDTATAVRIVVATTAVGLFSIPLVIVFGLWLTGTSP